MTHNEILKALREPFPSNRISWRVGRAGKSGDKIWVRALAYFDARDGMDRLDEVMGLGGWRDSYRKEGESVICRLELKIGEEWVGREDGAEETDIEAVKGGMSGAFKRACVKWGIGRYLYDMKEEFAQVVNQGTPDAIYGKTNEVGTFYWLPPQLPDWAKPESERKPTGKPNLGVVSSSQADPADYVFKIGKNKGKKVSDIDPESLSTFLEWIGEQPNPSPMLKEAAAAINAYLDEKLRPIGASK